ncbi:MAG: hypothetical protein FWD31_12885, partial [Planctomycetaceae bacterium]|nr:hypothetical protein [Planctomycetaceae bacterium]
MSNCGYSAATSMTFSMNPYRRTPDPLGRLRSAVVSAVVSSCGTSSAKFSYMICNSSSQVCRNVATSFGAGGEASGDREFSK